MTALPYVGFLLLAYFMGAIPFGVIIAKSKGVDLRKQGSGNIGATNVGRVLGRKFGYICFLLDCGKGFVPVLAAGLWLRRQGELDAGALYDVLENEVVPLFYDRGADGVPHAWVARQKNAIRTLAWNFSAHRMMMDYTLRCYLPASGALTAPSICPYRKGQ